MQPAAIAGDILRIIILDGKFQGVIAPTTPTGSLRTCHSLVAGEGMISPKILCPSAAFHRKFSTFVLISEAACLSGFPCSIVMIVAKRSLSSSTRSAILFINFAR